MKNGQRVQRLKTELTTCRQNGSAIEASYQNLAKLWTSLDDYQQAKTLEEISKEREEDKLHQFLMGIDESLYGGVKSAMLSRTPLPSLDDAYNVLTQDKESISLARMHEERASGVSFAVQTQTRAHCVLEMDILHKTVLRRLGIHRGGVNVLDQSQPQLHASLK